MLLAVAGSSDAIYIGGVTPGGKIGVREAVIAASSGAKSVSLADGVANVCIIPALVTKDFKRLKLGSSIKVAKVGVVPCDAGGLGVGSSSILLHAVKDTANTAISRQAFFI